MGSSTILKDGQIKRYITKLGLLLVVILLSVVFTLISEEFFTTSNMVNIARQMSVTGIVAVGMTMVIIIAGIDLSVGSILAFAGIFAASMFTMTNSAFIAILAGTLAGGVFGFINGFLTTKGRLAGFIATLAMMGIIRGLGFIYTDGTPISVMDPSFTYLGTGYIWFIPVPIIIMVIVLVFGHFLLAHTRFGRYVYAIGGNEKATSLSGVNVSKVKMAVYTIIGFLTGLAGVILAGRLASGQPNAGTGFELDVIAAVIVGGTSLFGGKGTIYGAFMGALLMAVISNGLTLINVSSYYQMVVKGLIIIVAVLIDNLSRKSD